MRNFLFCCIALALCPPALAQEVVYLRRDQVVPFLLGQDIGKLGGQVMDARAYTQQRQAQYAKLALLRREASECGNCAKRAQLEADVKTLRESLFREDSKICGAFDSLSDSNPAVGPVKKLMGYDDMCSQFNREAAVVRQDIRFAEARAEFERRVKAGDVAAYGTMGRRIMTTFRDRSYELRYDLACPYWAEGVRNGDRLSNEFFAEECGRRDKATGAAPPK